MLYNIRMRKLYSIRYTCNTDRGDEFILLEIWQCMRADCWGVIRRVQKQRPKK